MVIYKLYLINNLHLSYIFSSGKPEDFFLLRIIFKLPLFKEIRQTRAYSFQTLVGNLGGYIGLFVGYTIKEIPVFMRFLYENIKGK